MSVADFANTALTPELLKSRDEIREIAKGFGLDFFEVIFEMIDYDQINSFAAYSGFPVRYPHWRFGMDYDQLSKGYSWGLQKIYEMVINTDPSYAYLMKSNSIVDQKMVMAHVYGHVDFFKNNIWFSKTNRKMLDAMANHAVKIRAYIDRYGQDTVEGFIDHCLALENLIDPQLPFVSPPKDQMPEETDEDGEPKAPSSQVSGKLKVHRQYMDQYINPPDFLEEQKKAQSEQSQRSDKRHQGKTRDLLLFLMDYAPLENWQREVLTIIRDEAYYFVPQMQTKIMNEGWASYWHSKIMTEKYLKDSEIIDFAEHHSGTMAMAPGRTNPYKIGLEILRDIEDRWNRGRFGKEYDECDDMLVKAKWDKKLGLGRQKIFEVRRIYNDVMFIDEFLTAEVADRLKLYNYAFNRRTNQYEIVDRDYTKIKQQMLFQLTNMGQPFIYVVDGNYQNKGELLLWHHFQGMELDVKWARETMRAIHAIWGRPVNVESEVDGQKKLFTYNNDEFTEKFL